MLLPKISLPATFLDDVQKKVQNNQLATITVSHEAIGLILLAENESLLKIAEFEAVKHNPVKINELAFRASTLLEKQANAFHSRYEFFSFNFINYKNQAYQPVDYNNEACDVDYCIEVSQTQGIVINLALDDEIPENLRILAQVLGQELRQQMPCISSESLIECTLDEEEFTHIQQASEKLNKPIDVELYKTCMPEKQRMYNDDEEIANFLKTLGWYDKQYEKKGIFGSNVNPRITFKEQLAKLSKKDKKHPVYEKLITIFNAIEPVSKSINGYAQKLDFYVMEDNQPLDSCIYLLAGYEAEQSYMSEHYHHQMQMGVDGLEFFNVNSPNALKDAYNFFHQLNELIGLVTDTLEPYVKPVMF